LFTSLAAPLQGPVSMSLPFSPQSAGAVRRALVSWLTHHGSSDAVIDDARLVVTELVANAIQHASPLRNGTVLVRWRRDGAGIVLSVSDGGGQRGPEITAAGPESERGRGLAIVDALSPLWWAERTRRVHVIHAYLPLI